MDPEQETPRLVRMKGRKERLIERYLKLQDQADRANERIFGVCCEIENVNLLIQHLEESLRTLESSRSQDRSQSA